MIDLKKQRSSLNVERSFSTFKFGSLSRTKLLFMSLKDGCYLWKILLIKISFLRIDCMPARNISSDWFSKQKQILRQMKDFAAIWLQLQPQCMLAQRCVEQWYLNQEWLPIKRRKNSTQYLEFIQQDSKSKFMRNDADKAMTDLMVIMLMILSHTIENQPKFWF